MNDFLKILLVFLLGFVLFSSVVSATEVLEPTDQSEDSTQNVVDESTSMDDGADGAAASDVVLDLEPVISSIDDFNNSVSSSNELTLVRDYVQGMLLNMPSTTQYIFYPYVVDTVQHYYFYYDLLFDDSGSLIFGSYPCIDIYSVDGILYQSSGYSSLEGLPEFAYGSFKPFSALIDNQFHVNDLIVVLIGVLVMFILCRKKVFT